MQVSKYEDQFNSQPLISFLIFKLCDSRNMYLKI